MRMKIVYTKIPKRKKKFERNAKMLTVTLCFHLNGLLKSRVAVRFQSLRSI